MESKFTDADLQQLKEGIAGPREYGMSPDEVAALLHRLECAEACLTPTTDYCKTCHCEDCQSNIDAWLKSKGES